MKRAILFLLGYNKGPKKLLLSIFLASWHSFLAKGFDFKIKKSFCKTLKSKVWNPFMISIYDLKSRISYRQKFSYEFAFDREFHFSVLFMYVT